MKSTKVSLETVNTPNEWKSLELQEITEEIYRYPTYYNIKYVENGIPEVRGELINHDGTLEIDKSRYRFISSVTSSRFLRTILKKGDFVMSVRGTIGKVAIVEKNMEGANITANLIRISPKHSIVHPLFLKYHFLSEFFQETINNLSPQTTIKTIQAPLIKAIKILIPPIREQQKISEILSQVDELIQKTDQIVEQTQRLKKGLMQRLLTKGIGHTKFKKTEFGEIPEEWKFEKILNNSTLKGRIGWQGLTTAEYCMKGEFYLVTGTDFKNGKIDWKNCVYVDEERYVQDENIQLKKNDVLVTKDGTIGKIAYIDLLSRPTTLNTGIFVIRPIDKAYFPLFLYYVLYSDYFLKFLNRLKAGSTINHLYQKDFINFSFPVPPYSEQQKIASILSNVDELIEKQKTRKSKIQNLKKGLMQQLLTGKIRVKI